MRIQIAQASAAALLFLGIVSVRSVPAHAEPPNHPEACAGKPVPDGVLTCENTSGAKAICTADGDWMCCKPNEIGGYDCEQIVSKPVSPTGGALRAPIGPLQNAPGAMPPRTATPKAPATGGIKQ